MSKLTEEWSDILKEAVDRQEVGGVSLLFLKDGKIFNEIVRGESSRKDFFNQIMEVVTLLGGDTSNVL